MMRVSEPPSHLRFIQQVHRRWVAWRVVEFAGLGVAVGAAVALVLLPLALWQDRPAIGLTSVVLGIGAAVGGMYGLTRRPRLLETAMRIDRQFGTHDLLSTVLRPDGFQDPQFARILGAQADGICERRGVNELIVRRLGGRAWGGIGLAAAMILTISLLGSQPRESVAGTADGSSSIALDPAPDIPDRSLPNSPQSTPLSRGERSTSPKELKSDEADEASADPRGFSEVAPPLPKSGTGSSADAGSGQAGRTDEARIPKSGIEHTGRSEHPADGFVAPGTKGTNLRQVGRDLSAGGISDSASRPVPNTPLSDSIKPSNQPSRSPIADDPTLSTYRDILRVYFDTDEQRMENSR